jgi:hypothetical protein
MIVFNIISVPPKKGDDTGKSGLPLRFIIMGCLRIQLLDCSFKSPFGMTFIDQLPPRPQIAFFKTLNIDSRCRAINHFSDDVAMQN